MFLRLMFVLLIALNIAVGAWLLLGQLPLVPELREGADSGNPIVVSDPDDEASKVFRAIAHSLTHELAPHRVYRTELKIV